MSEDPSGPPQPPLERTPMKLPLYLAPAAALLTLASPAMAGGTTHDVQVGPGFTYSPQDLVIDVGDTVLWTWAGGFHDVESGVDGVFDGNFDSGAPTAAIGVTFSVTFDEAFLAANPMPDNFYPYYCIVHFDFGQIGSITVNAGTPSAAANYGNCNSTPGSLFVSSGDPILGTVFTVAAHDPVGSSPAGATLPLLLVSIAPDPNYPCGTPLPGFGMSPPGSAGDLLIFFAPSIPQILGGLWNGAPVDIALPLPNDPVLLGLDLYLQAVMASASTTRLTEGLEITLGDS